MLFRVATLQKIKSGEITLAFRRWKRPTVQAGGTLTTPIGLLAIHKVDKTTFGSITSSEARRAGFASKAELVDELRSRTGSIYRIEFELAGADPRIELRKANRLSGDQLESICQKLRRMDRASRHGPWTRAILKAIDRHPRVAASQLAKSSGFEKDWLKVNVRKLKNMGLTISHGVGYELSPRGKALLKHLK